MRRLNVRSLIPNLITLSGLSFGLSSIRFAIEGEFNLAVICILFAAICDVLDGMLARHLHSESDLGFQLDSLSIANLIELKPKLKPDKVIKFGIKDLKCNLLTSLQPKLRERFLLL